MDKIIGWVSTPFMLIATASWLVVVYSYIGVLRNMKARFWPVVFHSHRLLFNKEELQLNEIGETHHLRMIKSMKVFIVLLICFMLLIFTNIWAQG